MLLVIQIVQESYPIMFKSLRNRTAKAQGLVEYALILVLVAVVSIVVLSQVGSSVAGTFCKVDVALGGSGAPGCATGTLNVAWNPPAVYGPTTATASYTVTNNNNPVGANVTCTNGFTPSGGGGNVSVTGPRGGNSTCTANYNGLTASWFVSFGA